MNNPFFALCAVDETPLDMSSMINDVCVIMGFLGWGMSFRYQTQAEKAAYLSFLECPNVNPNSQIRSYLNYQSIPDIKPNPFYKTFDIRDIQGKKEDDSLAQFILKGHSLKEPVRQLLCYIPIESLDKDAITIATLSQEFKYPILNLANDEHLDRAKELICTSQSRLGDRLWFG